MASNDEALRERVAHERKRRGLSISAAARTGGASHETWRTYEETGNLTPKVVQMVAAAFAWPLGWHQGESDPTAAEQRDDAIMAALDAVRGELVEVGVEIKQSRVLGAERAESFAVRLERFESAIGNLIVAVGSLEQRIQRIEPPNPPRGPRGVPRQPPHTNNPDSRSHRSDHR